MSAQTTAVPGPTLDSRRTRRAAHARPTEGQPPAARQDRSPGSRFRLAPRTVRARIVCLLALPVVSLTALWGIAAVNTISAAYTQAQLRTMDSAVSMPLADTVSTLQQERSAAAAYLAVPDADASAFNARISATRSAGATLLAGADQSAAAADNLNPALVDRLTATSAAISALSQVRTAVLGHSTSAAAAEHAYSDAIADAFAVQSTLASTSGAPGTAQAGLELSEAREQLAVQDTVLGAAHAAGTLSVAAYQQFTGAVYAERGDLQQAGIDLSDPTATSAGANLTTLQNAVLAAGPGTSSASTGTAQNWGASAPTVLAALDSAERAASTPAAVNPYRRLLTTGSGFGVLLGFFALAVSLLISVGIGRRLVTDLVGLRDYALDLAGRRLPDTMARLRAGQLVEPGEQAPPLDPDAGELGQVADALAVAAQAAMQAAVERAELVSGVSGVFLNLARRSQVLVHRQLALLDAMERRIEEPDHLEDLFRLDHLATRMRRHAEGLIILSGATPGRGWRHPVDLTDVVRAAAAEAEDYPRVEVRRMPRARVLGPVVADLTHLLAELIENATSFSPPHTRVVVGGEPVGSGFAIEIEDRGLGMSPDALREANRRIGESSGDDLFDSDRLGLFVVSRLARRHEIRVSLCASAYGGITAVVLIPSGVMQAPGESEEPAPHDLGVNGAMPHGPLTAPEAFADLNGSGQAHRESLPGAPAGPPTGQLGAMPAGAPHPNQAPHASQAAQETRQANGRAHRSAVAEPQAFDVPGSVIPRDPRESEPEDDGPMQYSPLGPDGLPRRVRQANLAPQLRQDPGGEPAAQAPGGGGSARPVRPQRSPEQNRATMSAFQHGFTRGRADNPVTPPSPVASPAAPQGAPAADPADHENHSAQRGDDAR